MVVSIVPGTAMGPTTAHTVDQKARAGGDAPGLGSTVLAIHSVRESGGAPIDGYPEAVSFLIGVSANFGPDRRTVSETVGNRLAISGGCEPRSIKILTG